MRGLLGSVVVLSACGLGVSACTGTAPAPVNQQVVDDDGTVVVADQETRLRWFGADGALRLEAGGKGEGPGEFESR